MKAPRAPTDLWEQMDSLRTDLIPQAPANSFTTKDYAAKYNLSGSHAREQVLKLRESGKLTVVAVLRNVRYYRPAGLPHV